MSQPLNRVPSGLLSLFQIKSLGENPNRFEDAVRPTLEMSNFYFATTTLRNTEAESTNVSQADQGTALAIVEVPTGEIWAVRSILSQAKVATFAAAEYIVTYPSLRVGPAGQVTHNFGQSWLHDTNPLKDGMGRYEEKTFDNPLFIPGGSAIFSSIWQYNGGTVRVDVKTKVLYYRMEV